jgi:cell division protein FtsL
MATQVITGQFGIEVGRRDQDRITDRLRERNLSLLAAQHRARRGPTPEVLFAKKIDNSRLVKAADPQRAREMRTFAAAMALFLGLLLIYGWQHFSAIEYGYHIEAEKQQLRQLQEVNRGLQLTEAQLNSPARIDQLANSLGLQAPQPGQVVYPDGSTVLPGNPNAPVLAEATPPVIH